MASEPVDQRNFLFYKESQQLALFRFDFCRLLRALDQSHTPGAPRQLCCDQ
jgi:hypothetical protein